MHTNFNAYGKDDGICLLGGASGMTGNASGGIKLW
jgi:hypothetical protein